MRTGIFSTNNTVNAVIAIVSFLGFGISNIMIAKIEDDVRDEIKKLKTRIEELEERAQK